MICHMHEDLYRYVEKNHNTEAYRELRARRTNFAINGDLSTFVIPILDDADPALIAEYDSYEKFPGYEEIMPPERFQACIDFNRDETVWWNNLPLPPYLKLIREIQNFTAKEPGCVMPVFDRSKTLNEWEITLQRLEKSINDLPDGTEKISCKMWFLQHKLLFLRDRLSHSYFSPDILQIRKEILSLYKSDKSFEYAEETHITAVHNASDVFFIENKNIFLKDADAIKSTYERFINSLRFYEEMAWQKYPTVYMKNRLGYVKLWYHSLFYSYFILSKVDSEKDFFDLDIWFEEKFNSIEFKYKDFNYIKLKYMWNRFTGNFGFSNFKRALSTLQEIYDVIVSNMQDKQYMGKKLHYLNTVGNINRFFALILTLRKLEKEFLNDFSFYVNKNQFNNLIFSKNEEIMIAIETEPHKRYMEQDWNYSFIKTKLEG